MQVYYVILKSRQDVLWRIIGWSENPYIARSYYKGYHEMYPDKLIDIQSVNCTNTVDLARYVREELGADIQDVVNTHLNTKLSKDERCYVIYPNKYAESFSDDFMTSTKVAFTICDLISKVAMGMVPLMKYVKPEYDIINELLFVSYMNTSVRKMLQRGPTVTPISELIDVVHFWRFLANKGTCQFSVCTEHGSLVPLEAVFVDNDYISNKERKVV